MLLRVDWSMLSEGDREGVLQYATTLCNGVAETVSAMSHQLKYKGSDKDKSVDKEKDEDKEKISFYSPLSPAAAIACLSQLQALGDNDDANDDDDNDDSILMIADFLIFTDA